MRVLTGIRDQQRRYGEERAPPATDEEVAVLAVFVRRHAGVAVPRAYLALLRVANGVDVNGTTIYATRERRRANGT